MPEGPELKLSCELIKPLIVNKQIKSINFPSTSRYFNNNPENINFPVSLIVKDIKVKGKFMYWELENDIFIFCTYGMSGQWSPKPGKHISMSVELLDLETNNISHMYFNDPRHFGTIKFVKGKSLLNNKLNELGWCPLQDSAEDNFNFIKNKLSKNNKPISQVMMDQSIFCGTGNYIRAEVLYASKINPWKTSSLLSDSEISIIMKNCEDVMNKSYEYQGATLHTYKTVYGEEGKYSSFFQIYGKKKDNLGNPVIKEKTPEGRTLHWCPNIQK